jgi:hypothetical protein
MKNGKCNGRWRPSLSQLELIAEYGIAKVPLAMVADALGIPQPEFVEWQSRLAAVRFMSPAEIDIS